MRLIDCNEPVNDIPLPLEREFFAPVILRCATGWFTGFADRLGETWIRVRTLDEIPARGEACEMTLVLGDKEVVARGYVKRIDPKRHRYVVEMTHLYGNAKLLLAVLVGSVSDRRLSKKTSGSSRGPSRRAGSGAASIKVRVPLKP